MRFTKVVRAKSAISDGVELFLGVCGMIFVVILSLAITYGIQNRNDRRMTEKVEAAATNLTVVENKIGAIKQRARTSSDYMSAYAEIGDLLPDLDSRIKEYAGVYEEAGKSDEVNLEWIDLLRADAALTNREVLTVQNMATLPTGEQEQFWQKEFKPLLLQENDLNRKRFNLSLRLALAKSVRKVPSRDSAKAYRDLNVRRPGTENDH